MNNDNAPNPGVPVGSVYPQSNPGVNPGNPAPAGQPPISQPPALGYDEPKKSVNPIRIIVAIIVVAGLAAGGYFLYQLLTKPGSKTIAEFEKIVTDLDYYKAENSTLSDSDSNGEFVTYYKAEDTAADGIAIYYVMKSKDKLKELIDQDSTDFTREALSTFDWSKPQNEYYDCMTNQKNVHICLDVIQRDNSMLVIFYQSAKDDKAESEVDKLVTAMGYNK